MIAGTNFNMVRFDDVWPQVKAQAMRWIDTSAVKESGDWHSACLMNDDGIVTIKLKPGSFGLTAFIIIAVSTGQAGAFLRNEAAIVEIARDMGASTLAFRSDRPGWQRLLGEKWRHRSGDLYERRV